MSKKKFLIPVAAGATALALVGGMGFATAMQTSDVSLTVDGATSRLEVRQDTVEDVLAAQGVELGEHDVVMPAQDTEVTDGLEITVLLARPLEVTIDGEARTVWTTASTVDEALGSLNLDARDSLLSTSRSASIGREGLSLDVTTAKDVTVVAHGQERAVRGAGTVADVLRQALILPDGNDSLNPAPETALTDGMRIEFTQVDVVTSTKERTVAFEKKTVESDTMPKGETKVTTKGADGLVKEVFAEVYHDGVLVSSEKQSQEVTKEPVAEVTTVGTYVKPKPKPEPKSKPKSKSKPDPARGAQPQSAAASEDTASSAESSTPARTGGKFDWMRAAGIPESDWTYVDFIVGKESGWNPNAVNSSSGACGLVQALPCSKLGSNWRDPVTALKWQHSYVKSRYGGYAGAYNFWKRKHWY